MNSQKLNIEGKAEFQEIQVDGVWAYCWNRLEVNIKPASGPAMRREGYTLSILRKREGKWLLYRDANLLGPPVKEE
jgi:ketosteroid isomerase-like protein